MADFLTTLDRALRRNSAIPRMEPVRRLLRGPYLYALGRGHRGLLQNIGGAFEVRLPARYCSKFLEMCEPEVFAALRSWLDRHPQGTFVDIGCSKGYMSAAMLHGSPDVRVEAIDSDVFSLGIARQVCSLAPGVERRLRFSLCLMAAEEAANAEQVRAATAAQMARPEVKGDPREFTYVNMDSELPENLPKARLDDLLLDELASAARPVLLKCDVEGAEMAVLKGAELTIVRLRPEIVLSVHPTFVGKFGTTVEEVRSWLMERGYDVSVIAVDHEEHWLCTPR